MLSKRSEIKLPTIENWGLIHYNEAIEKQKKYVDEIIPYDTEQSLIDLLESTHIHLRFIGEDWADKYFTGKGLHEIYYTNRQHSFSSSGLRRLIRESST